MTLTMSPSEKRDVNTIIQYLKEFPEQMSRRGNVDLQTKQGVLSLTEKVLDAKRKLIIPNIPSTVPDPMVSHILEFFYGYSHDKAIEMKTEHQHAMAAENSVGDLLESYISSEAEQFGWVRCVGNTVRAIDFINKTPNGWLTLQIKNRDNSENSSSSSVRAGTSIKKWFRTFSRTGKTNWENFPDKNLSHRLSEDGFQRFVASYLESIKARPA